MAAKERADLLRSARRKILQNSICRQSGQTEIEFCKNFCRVLPLQGLAAKAGSPLQSRHQWERAGWNRSRCLPWRPDLQPLRQSPVLLVDAPLPVGLPAITFAALPARPPREGAPGCRRHRKRPAFDGVAWDWGETCSGSDMPRLDPDGGLRDRHYLPHRSRPAPRPRRRHEDDLSAHDTGEAERTGRARGRLPYGRREATGIIAANVGVLSAGRGRARRPPNRRVIAHWRDGVPRRSCAPRSARRDPGQRCAASPANRKLFEA